MDAPHRRLALNRRERERIGDPGSNAMRGGAARAVVRQFRTLYQFGVVGSFGDEQLLERFLARRDESSDEAFAELVQRHGPMVLGVCRRILRDPHEAEDAFQATFLVLARKAASVVRREKVASWLYGVAARTAKQACARGARRRAREERVSSQIYPEPSDGVSADELRAILDEELARLPARHRDPLVLCELEGLSRTEAAQRLGIPEGTLSSRLARGKDRLRVRLVSRGVSLTTAAISAILICEARAATVPLSLLESTIRAATLAAAGLTAAAAISAPVALLSEGVLKAMFIAKLKGIVLAVGTMTAIVSGAIVLAQEGPGGPGRGNSPTAGVSRDQDDGRRSELEKRAGYPNSSALNDRTAALERKLDLILQALGRTDPAGYVNMMPGQAPPRDYARFPKEAGAAPDNVAFQPGPDVKMPPANMRRPSRRWDAEKKGDSQEPRTVVDRIQILEQQMQDVQQRLERMEAQLNSLDRRFGGARNRLQDSQKGELPEKR
jgi:RNA polymerase sigma-70 factor (ECF subfamily)